MAATFTWSESNGVGEAVTDGIVNLNVGNTDAKELVPADWPILAGENSYEKWIRAKFGGTFTEISNMKLWKSAGAYKTGEALKWNETSDNIYHQPVKTASTHATSDIPTSLPGTLNVHRSTGENTMIAAGYTRYFVFQLQSTVLTPAGAVNTKTITFQYDET